MHRTAQLRGRAAALLRSQPGIAFAITLVVFAGAYLGLHAFLVPQVGTTVWYPLAGVAAAVAVRRPGPRLPVAAGAFAGTALAGVWMGWTAPVWIGYGLANAVEVLAFVWVHALLHGGRRPLERVGDVVRMAATSVAAVTAGAATFILPYVLVVVASDPTRTGVLLPGARGYWASHLTGMLVVGPALLAVHPRGSHLRTRPVEVTLQLVATLLVSSSIFAPGQHLPLAFVVVLPLLWAAGRLGMTHTLIAIALSGTVIATATARGYGPLMSTVDPLDGMSATQLLLVVNAVAALSLALLARHRDALTRAVAVSEARYRRTLEHALLGIAVIRLKATGPSLELTNPAARALLGDDSGRAWFDRLSRGDRAVASGVLDKLHRGTIDTWQGELHLVTAAGEPRWFEARLATLPPGEEDLDRLVSAQLIDVTERRLAEHQLRELALHDALTGLPNRTLILDRIAFALDGRTRTGTQVAVLFCDLDDFKIVNDSTGHAAGDAVLIDIGARIAEAVRPGDTVGRLGGDEFVVVCPDVRDEHQARQIAERILSGVGKAVDGLPTAASIGFAVSDAGADPVTLLDQADTAMYAAKRGGKNRVFPAEDWISVEGGIVREGRDQRQVPALPAQHRLPQPGR